MSEHKNNCLICGEKLEYFQEAKKMECMICHQEYESTACCKEGHFICDACHSKNGVDIIIETCRHTKSKNPIEIMLGLMEQPFIHMHGPEHHVMVGAALLAAYKNAGGQLDFERALREMKRRGSQVPGGICGFWGSCGAAVSTGIFMSIITEASPLSQEPWAHSNLMTSRVLNAVGTIGGPRCCKRNSSIAVLSAIDYVSENFGIQMEKPSVLKCAFTRFNDQCIQKRCPFFEGTEIK